MFIVTYDVKQKSIEHHSEKKNEEEYRSITNNKTQEKKKDRKFISFVEFWMSSFTSTEGSLNGLRLLLINHWHLFMFINGDIM